MAADRLLTSVRRWAIDVLAAILGVVLMAEASLAATAPTSCQTYESEQLLMSSGSTAVAQTFYFGFSEGDKVTLRAVGEFGDPAAEKLFFFIARVNGQTEVGAYRGPYSGDGTLLINFTSTGPDEALSIEAGADSFAPPSFATTHWPISVYAKCIPGPDATTTTLQSSDTTVTVGDAVTFTAAVANANKPQITPTGSVEFFDGQSSLGTVALSGGTASLTTTALVVGNHGITAKYLGATDFHRSSTSDILQQTINRGPLSTTTTVTPGINPAYGNLPLQVTVTVTAEDGSTPSGMVTLFDDNNYFNLPMDGGPVALVNGTATFTVRRDLLAAFIEEYAFIDTAAYRAEFVGDAGFANSTSSSVDVRFKPQPLEITLTASPNPAKPGQEVTITGRVKSTVADITFPGAFNIYSDGELVSQGGHGPGGVSSADPMIGTTTYASPGQHTIRLYYGVYDSNGWARFENDHYLTLTVANEDATTTTLQSSKSSAVTGEEVTFTATVSNSGDAAVVPTGTVQFFDGDTLLGEGTLSGGTASLTTSFAAVGSYSITARYMGETDKFLPSTSGALLQNIETNIVETSVTLSATPNPSQLGQEVSLTATITSASGTPTGTVEFFSGADSLGTASLSGGKAVLTTSALDGGSHDITAVYGGDGVHGASTSEVMVQVVDTSSAALDVVQQKASQAAASISTDIMTDTTSGAISDALSGQVQVLSASDGQVGFTWAPGLTRGGTMVVPTADAPVSIDNPWRFWAKVRYTDWDADDLDGKQLNGLIGASMLFGDGMVAGLVAGYEHYDYESTAASTLKGDGLSLGGYLGGKLSDSLTFDTQLHTTVIGYDVASGGVTGDFDAMRLIAAGGFAYALHEGALSFTPTLRASGMWEWQDGYFDSAAVAHRARGFGNARASGGARVAYTIPLSDGGRLTPYVSGFGDWRVSDGDQTTDSALDGLSGRIESGFDLQTKGGINFGASVEFMGLGIEDTLATSYRASLSIPF